jgi:hypothetical protein
MGSVRSQYDEDFYAWTQAQAALLRQEKASDLDYAHLAEELESLGKREWYAVESRLAVLVRHLLKWRYQPQRRQRGRSWRSTIWEQRSRIRRLVRLNPSLRRHLPAMIAEEYPSIRRRTLEETGLPPEALPTTCPWTVEQVLDETFWPPEDE